MLAGTVAAVLLLLTFVGTSSGQEAVTVQDVEQLRLQIRILDDIRALNQALSEAATYLSLNKDFELGLRYLQGADEPGAEQGMGYVLGQVRKLGGSLGIKIGEFSSLIGKIEDPAGRTQQVLNAANGVLRLTRAAAEAERSSGEDKLRDLADFFGEVKGALPLLSVVFEGFAVNPVIGSYLIIIGKAIENIADSAAIIEARTRETDEIIRYERERVLAPARSPAEETEAMLAEVQEAYVAELRELEIALDEPAYDEIWSARNKCLQERNLDASNLDSLYDATGWARWEARELWQALRRLEGGERPNVMEEIRSAEAHVETVERRKRMGAAAEDEVDRARDDVVRLRERFADINGDVDATEDELLQAFDNYRRSIVVLTDFARCVKRELANAEHADRHFLERHYTQYLDPDDFWAMAENDEIADRVARAAGASVSVRILTADPEAPPQVDWEIAEGEGRLIVWSLDAQDRAVSLRYRIRGTGVLSQSGTTGHFESLPPGEYDLSFRYDKSTRNRPLGFPKITGVSVVAGQETRIQIGGSGQLGRLTMVARDATDKVTQPRVRVFKVGTKKEVWSHWADYIDLPPGTYDVRFGYLDHDNGPAAPVVINGISVNAGTETQMEIGGSSRLGRLWMTATDAGAQPETEVFRIYSSGGIRRVWSNRLSDHSRYVDLPPGRYEARFRFNKGIEVREVKREVNVAAGRRTEIHIENP
jgi:hypothetical protein